MYWLYTKLNTYRLAYMTDQYIEMQWNGLKVGQRQFSEVAAEYCMVL